MTDKTPGTYRVYKKTSAAQFATWAPKYDTNGYLEKEGALAIEVAKSSTTDKDGNPVYDWQNKIKFAIGIADIALLLDNPEKKLVHDYQGAIKTLAFVPGTGNYEGTWMMHLNETAGENKRAVAVPLSGGEFAIIGILLKTSVTRALGW